MFCCISILAHFGRLLATLLSARGEPMKPNQVFLIAALSPFALAAAAAQNVPPPSPPQPPSAAAAPQQLPQGSPATYTSRVSAVVYGPQSEVQGLVLRNGVAVSLPPDLAMRLQSSVTKGARVQVSGMQQVIAGQTSLSAQSVAAGGQTFIATQPPPDRGTAIAGAAPPPPPPPVRPPDPRARRGPAGPPPPPPPPAPAAAGIAPPPPPPADADAPPAPP